MSHSAVFEQHINDLAGEPNEVPEGDPAAIGVRGFLVGLPKISSGVAWRAPSGMGPPLTRSAVEMSDGEVVGQDALWVVGCEGESRGEQQACLPRAEVTGEHGPDTCQARTSGGVEGFDGA